MQKEIVPKSRGKPDEKGRLNNTQNLKVNDLIVEDEETDR